VSRPWKGNNFSFPPMEGVLLRLSRTFSATLTGRLGMGTLRMGAEGSAGWILTQHLPYLWYETCPHTTMWWRKLKKTHTRSGSPGIRTPDLLSAKWRARRLATVLGRRPCAWSTLSRRVGLEWGENLGWATVPIGGNLKVIVWTVPGLVIYVLFRNEAWLESMRIQWSLDIRQQFKFCDFLDQ
jgi:hypothetical protein